MTSANPPYPWFNGIKYNPPFFASSSTGDLTKAQANALYLRKTFPDTATAIETFQAGIETNKKDAIGLSALYIGNTTTNLFVRALNALSIIATNPSGASLVVKGDYMAIGDANETVNLSIESFTLLNLGSTTITTESDTLNLNNLNPNANTVAIGNLTGTSSTDINGTALKLNSTKTTANTVAIGNATGTTTITVNKPITIGYTILPSAGQIGYVLNAPVPFVQNREVGTAVSQTNLCSTSLVPILPKGTWMVALTAGVYAGLTSGTITQCYIAIVYNVSTNIPAKQTNIMSYTPPINTFTNIMNCSGIIESDGIGACVFDHSLTHIGVGAAFSTRPSDSWSWKFIRVG